MKMKIKKISTENQQLSASGKATGINAFKIIRIVHLLPLKAIHQIFSIITTCQFFFVFFFCLRTLLLEIVLWSKLLCGNLSRYDGINIIENAVDNRSLSTDKITNSHAELFFLLEKVESK